MGAHHATPHGRTRLTEWAAQHGDRIVLPAANLTAAVACAINLPGASPSLGFVAAIVDLRVWAAVYAAAAVLLVVGRLEAGHLAGMVGWLMLAAGAVLALVTLSTPSPSGSLISAGLMASLAARHLIGFGHAATVRREGGP